MTTYTCDDGNCPTEIVAQTPREAAEKYVSGGAWGPIDKTIWIKVSVSDSSGERIDTVRVAVDPDEPKCKGGQHDWHQAGVRGSGGGVIVSEQCASCGHRKVTNTWDQDPQDGVQGLTSIRYCEPELA